MSLSGEPVSARGARVVSSVGSVFCRRRVLLVLGQGYILVGCFSFFFFFFLVAVFGKCCFVSRSGRFFFSSPTPFAAQTNIKCTHTLTAIYTCTLIISTLSSFLLFPSLPCSLSLSLSLSLALSVHEGKLSRPPGCQGVRHSG